MSNIINKIAAQRFGQSEYIRGDQDYHEAIHKIASDATNVAMGFFVQDQELTKVAEEELEKLSAEDEAVISQYVSYGQGIARGEVLGKEAGYIKGSKDMFDAIMKIAAAVVGEDGAAAIADEAAAHADITEEDVGMAEEAEAIKEEITEAAVEQLLESVEDPNSLSEEEAAQILEVAETAGEIGLQHILENQGEATE